MKVNFSDLPDHKQQEINEILEIIKEEADPVKVILFGSHANGNWVEDEYVENGVRFSYISDYDFLVVIKKGEQKEQAIISHIENRSNHFSNVVSPIVHDIDYINEGLSFGQYFFTDIIKEGILLFDTGQYAFAKPKGLTPLEEQEKAQEYFDIWFPQAEGFLKISNYCLNEGDYRIGAFQLHQATECFYSALLLVHTGYKPKTHNLQKLRNYAKHISADLYNVFRSPILDEHEYKLFDLLKRGYIAARYKPEYAITMLELEELIHKVQTMQTLVKKLCAEKIASYK
ncbi:HEPN domain-containing protein [Pedobacter sp. N36a]|uniref:HEPN domain-containing protein n=1 Tax=Pedobacter sp. N36a TaxID=2767996 RepID=UPI0016573215|nr:HEPN domain-containing protein [Pedobacter sp. N36a]MBC8988262.1 HEPN domain-containing protein [Pedobacter sp. N36a]